MNRDATPSWRGSVEAGIPLIYLSVVLLTLVAATGRAGWFVVAPAGFSQPSTLAPSTIPPLRVMSEEWDGGMNGKQQKAAVGKAGRQCVVETMKQISRLISVVLLLVWPLAAAAGGGGEGGGSDRGARGSERRRGEAAGRDDGAKLDDCGTVGVAARS